MADHWTATAPPMLLDEGLCARGEPDQTSLDRRWLWRLESFLAVNGTNPGHHEMRRQLHDYLYETCAHHWHEFAAEDGIEAHRQCSWCNDVEWMTELLTEGEAL